MPLTPDAHCFQTLTAFRNDGNELRLSSVQTRLSHAQRNRLRLGRELELNFFYHHFLRVEQFGVVPMGPSKIRFGYAQRCAKPTGWIRCAHILSVRSVDFATFNDDASSKKDLEAGLNNLHRLLRARYGTYTWD